ncbi:hypothetical protein BGZ97_003871 [Linnemannia gamsii]|uniref:HCP-like protein n=1 Tax=Linnemannia gamsii TaxID=64522 RepID=A0A9P6QSG0_9FUNG|nr:hypothetical protein BGZ97_003871 [Linnemannia gamsii]
MNNTPKHKGCNNNLPDTQHSSKSNELQITKETDTATKSFDQTLLRANLGDRMLRIPHAIAVFGVHQDYAQAMTWYLKAANLGHVGSQHNVGFFHDNGIGVRQDYAQAMVWCLNTAEQGHPNSQYNIGTLYQRGEGVFQNYEISAE